MINFDFSTKNVLITGGTRGIGRAIAQAFTNSGANLIITGTTDEQTWQKKGDLTNSKYLQVDFTVALSRQAFFEKLEDLKIDVCINCAGMNNIKPHGQCSESDYDQIHDLNLKAPYFVSQSVSRGMREAGWGRIINIASIWGVITKENRSLYTSTKTGLIGMTRTLAVELAPFNVLVNSISPGFTDTELTKASLSAEEKSELEGLLPVKRFASPDEIASLVLFLASDSNSYIVGQNIVIDGGYTIV
ncbi:MAG: SDR family oxidoreductase [Lentisphaeraceae bacterium]|nr:SDR family oxidoreductase [Lentisphaeraceae bacterium]